MSNLQAAFGLGQLKHRSINRIKKLYRYVENLKNTKGIHQESL